MPAATSRTRSTSTSSTATRRAINPGRAGPRPRRITELTVAGGRRRPWFGCGSPPSWTCQRRSRTSTHLSIAGVARRTSSTTGLQQGLADDQRLVQRQALAGMIWSKQFFYYDVPQWLKGDPGAAAAAGGAHARAATTSGRT